MSTAFTGTPGWPADSGASPGPGGAPVYGRVRQAGGAPVSGATVTLIDTSGHQAGRSRTGTDGSYQVHVPRPGMYTLIATAASHRPQAAAVQLGGGPVEHDVLLAGAARLAGTIRAADSGTPVSGATVALADSRGEVLEARGTDDGGRYLFEALAPGRYTVAVSAPSFQPSALPVSVNDGAQVTVDAELHGRARVAGTARNTHGTVVADARVLLLDADGNMAGVATTGPDGRYVFENLSGSDYTVVASGYPPTASTLRITSGQPQSHDVQLGYPES
jgi:uncharacterized surface anchored protein